MTNPAIKTEITTNALCDFILRAAETWNSFSPLAEQLRARQGNGGPAAGGAAVPLPHWVAPIVARPAVRLTHRYAGANKAPTAFAVCGAPQGPLVGLLPGDSESIIVHVFETVEQYAEWSSKGFAFATSAGEMSKGSLPSSLSLQALVLALHAVDLDCAGHSKGEARPRPVPTSEFVRSLGRGLSSRDPQQLLSSFLLLTPGIGNQLAEIRPEDVASLIDAGFLISSVREDAETVFTLGEAASRLSGEFAAGWQLASGMQLSILTTDGPRSFYRCYIAPTVRTNHLIEINTSLNGAASAEYHAVPSPIVQARLLERMAAARQATAARPAPPSPSPLRPDFDPGANSVAPAAIVCGGCGHENAATIKFCIECGRPLSAAPPASAPDRLPQPSSRPVPSPTPALPDTTRAQAGRGLDLPADVEQRVRELLAADRKIQAVKLVSQTTGAGIKAAKDYVEGTSVSAADAVLAEGSSTPPKTRTPDEKLCHGCGGPLIEGNTFCSRCGERVI